MCRTLEVTGKCNDVTCRFAHSEVELRATHGFFKMKMCGFAQSGRCKHGQNCRFAHSPEELRQVRPPPPGANDNVLMARERATTLSAGSAQERHPAQKERNPSLFIYGSPPPQVPIPSEPASSNETIRERRAQRRQAAEDVQQQQQQRGQDLLQQQHQHQQLQQPQPQPLQQQQQLLQKHQQQRRSRREQKVQATRDVGAGGAAFSRNESDSAESSSGVSGSSATEVPRSEHTGSPPMDSDSSSGNGNGGSSGLVHPSSSGASGDSMAGAASEQRSKASSRRQHSQLTEAAANPPDTTTVLVVNVPNFLTQGALLSLFEDLNYTIRGSYDFFFCPWDQKRGENLGYAIFNFMDASYAATFQETWSGKELCRGAVAGQKPLKVVKASVQGFQANIDYFTHVEITPTTSERFRPMYRSEQGDLVALPLSSGSASPQASTPASAMQAAEVHMKDGAFPAEPVPEIPPTRLEGPRRQGRRNRALLEAATAAGQKDAFAAGPQRDQLGVQGPRPRQGRAAGRAQAPAKAGPHGRQHSSGHPQTAAGSSRSNGSKGSSWSEHRNPAASLVPTGDFNNPMCMQGNPDTGQVLRDYWMKTEETAAEGEGTQQVMTWPVMMTAVPWPMSEQPQKPSGSEGKCVNWGKGGGCFGPGQEWLVAGAGADGMSSMGYAPASLSSQAGGQVQLPQLMQCMMMPMEAVLPADSGSHGETAISMQQLVAFGGMQLPPQGLWWDPQDDEVYTD